MIRSWRTDRWGDWPGKLAAIGALSVAGTVTYLGWVSATNGGGILELHRRSNSSKPTTEPSPILVDTYEALANSWRTGTTSVTRCMSRWIGVAAILLVVAFLRLPVSYGAFALCVVVVALSGSNLDSFERYALSAFPLVMVGATFSGRPRIATVTVARAALLWRFTPGWRSRAYVQRERRSGASSRLRMPTIVVEVHALRDPRWRKMAHVL